MPSRSGVTPAQVEQVIAALWPERWAAAPVAERSTARLGVMEVIDGGAFTWPRWKITAKDSHRIKEAWVKIQNSSHELFKEAPLAPDKV